jgi:hypothetical protein
MLTFFTALLLLKKKIICYLLGPLTVRYGAQVTRMQSLGRDLAVAFDNLKDIQKRENQSDREMRQFRLTDVQKAQIAEDLGVQKKKQCGCCMLSFSMVNLPLRVSNKAVVDNRVNWSGGKRGWWSKMDEKLGHMPRCYSDTYVCNFCAQFFVDQDHYRPSFEKIQYEIRREEFFDRKREEQQYWDPLLMVEKDRTEQALLEKEKKEQEVLEEPSADITASTSG